MNGSGGDYVSAFNSLLRTKAREEFKLMLCDLDKCEPEQVALLRPLLLENKGHTSATNWGKYIGYTFKVFSDKTAHLQRLINKALEFLEEAENKDDQYYLAMHLRSARLKSDHESCVKYFENVIMKKKIGLRFAALYIEWSKAILRLEPTRGSGVFIKAKMVLEKGIELKSEPQEVLIDALKQFKEADGDSSRLATAGRAVEDIVTVREDGGLVINATTGNDSVFSFEQETAPSTTKAASSSSVASKNTFEGAEDVTQEMKHSVSASKKGPSTVEKKTLGGIGAKKTRFGGLGMMGKVGRCQRVAKKNDDDSDLDSSRDMSFDNGRTEDGGGDATSTTATLGRGMTGTMDMSAISMHNSSALETLKESSNRSSLTSSSTGSKRKSTSSSERSMDDVGEDATATATATGTNKLDLSKYIDDKLLNFDPQGARSTKKRSKTSRGGDASSSSSAMNSSALGSTTTTTGGNGTSMLSGSTTKEPGLGRREGAPQSATKRGLGSDAKRGSIAASSIADRQPTHTEANKENDGAHAANQSSNSKTQASDVKKPRKDRREDAPVQEVRFAQSSPVSSSSRSRERRRDDDELDLSSFNDAFKMVTINQQRYLRFGTLGKGGSSCVYSVISEDSHVYAFKKVFVGSNSADPEALFESYVNEIDLLNSLKGSPFIIQLMDSEVDKDNLSVSMIMEAGEIDLSKVLKKRNQVNGISPFFIRMIWSEMLESVDHIHEHRIVHGDLKPANFVFVKGHLKLIDFGIAKSFSNDTTNIYRDSQIGTINYMAPEAIVAPRIDEANSSSKGNKLRLGRASDVWSLGCILYQLVYGSPPFAALNTIQKLHAIPNPTYDISYPRKMTTAPIASTAGTEATSESVVWTIHEHTVDSMKACLFRDPVQRAPIKGEGGLLTRPFLTMADADTHII